MNLPASNSMAEFLCRGHQNPTLPDALYHDFVIDASKRNKLKD
jgi:hypothetical protein